ncbi:MAG: serine hydroxymethyltransferase [Candidatus Diapherotrites archaeon]|uniref:Serine hydroxymethyltransferase n=1 Tax=Candidatus Iainarchaeum sp. TaxID=3101447 RepID=A0A939C8Y8_9ARCH|nr:serine hydroxymethyltransferase [Candidatus Diapherotrites archaeon]
MHLDFLKEEDTEIYNAIQSEKQRQMEGIELIPSENLVSQAVLEAMGSVPTNKYSEGYPGKRYYGGNEFIDVIENLAIERCKKLFKAEHANVQPLSGSPANMAVYFAVMEPNDTFMGMKLTEGGHLTHGHPVNFSGKLYNCVQYGVDRKTEKLDYDEIEKQAKETKPKLLLSGYTAYPREIDFKRFREIADKVGAFCMADIAHIAGLCAAGVHENPVPYFDAVTTTTHKTLRGPRGAVIMCKKDFAEKIDKSVFPGMQGGPHDHITAAKAVCFKEALQPSFKDYAKQIVKNSKALAKELMDKGLRIVSNGTDNHLMLVDVFKSRGLSGKEAELALEKAGIYCNKNTIPFDKRTPWDPSGIRIGTPVLTTRGMKEADMKEVASFIAKALDSSKSSSGLEAIKNEVKAFCINFPFYR